jgi:1-acyl-sn-glycerol-3-phosphate acyltransferase
MSRPKVELPNYVEVYKYYRERDPNPRVARAAHYLVSKKLKPHVAFAPGAQEQIVDHLKNGKKLLTATNHVHALDPFHIASAMQTEHVFAPMIARTVIAARPDLFSAGLNNGLGLGRRALDGVGGFPAFRSKDLGEDADETERLLQHGAADAMIDTAVVKVDRGFNLTMFGEGERNKVDPKVVRPILRGIGIIFSEVQQAQGLAMLPGGLYYPPGGTSYDPVLYIGRPMLEGAKDPTEVRGEAHSAIQHAVDQAVQIAT